MQSDIANLSSKSSKITVVKQDMIGAKVEGANVPLAKLFTNSLVIQKLCSRANPCSGLKTQPLLVSRYTVQTLHPSLNYRLLLLLIDGMVKGMNSIWPLITQLCWHPQTPVRRYKALGSWVPSNHIQPVLFVLMDAGQQPPNGRGPAPLIEGKIPLSTLF
jgi:hypothetical protein